MVSVRAQIFQRRKHPPFRRKVFNIKPPALERLEVQKVSARQCIRVNAFSEFDKPRGFLKDRSVSDVTRILDRVQLRDSKATDELLPLVYEELRKLAAHKMANEASDQTLQPTALVHEAWLRLGGDVQPHFENRGHFFSAAAEAMRRILVEKARHKHRLRHGGALQRVDFTDLDVAIAEDDNAVLAVSEALDRLSKLDPVAAELIKLRFFGGLANVEAARILGLSERTAKRAWSYARAWLFDELKRTL